MGCAPRPCVALMNVDRRYDADHREIHDEAAKRTKEHSFRAALRSNVQVRSLPHNLETGMHRQDTYVAVRSRRAGTDRI